MSSNGVRHLQGGGSPETEGTKIPGIDIRADSAFRIACVLTLVGIRSTGAAAKIRREAHCHSIPSLMPPNPIGRVCKSACICGNASSVNSDETADQYDEWASSGKVSSEHQTRGGAPSTTSRTATPVIRYFRSRSNGTARTQTDPPKLCPTSFAKLSAESYRRGRFVAHQERWACSGIGEHRRQEARAVVNQCHYVEICINISRLAFGSGDGLSCECVRSPSGRGS